MGIYVKTWVTDLAYFPFWSGGKQNAEKFTYEEMQRIMEVLEDINNGENEMPMEETQINDLFWFKPEIICEWIGIDYINDYLNR